MRGPPAALMSTEKSHHTIPSAQSIQTQPSLPAQSSSDRRLTALLPTQQLASRRKESVPREQQDWETPCPKILSAPGMKRRVGGRGVARHRHPRGEGAPRYSAPCPGHDISSKPLAPHVPPLPTSRQAGAAVKLLEAELFHLTRTGSLPRQRL